MTNIPHQPIESVRYELPLGDRLLLTVLSGTQAALPGTPPWYYEITSIGLGVVQSGTVTGTQLYKYIDLESGTFGPHVGTTLWTSIWSGTTGPSGSPHAVGRFNLSGIYEFSGTQTKLAGLLGENSVVQAPSGSNYQAGHLLKSRTILYASASLSTVLSQLEFDRRFVTDAIPDNRFFIDREKETEI